MHQGAESFTPSTTKNVVIREYHAQEPIVTAGAPCNCFYVVLQGVVEILCAGIRIRLLQHGDIFGLEYFFLNQPYTTSARAMTAVRVAVYDVGMLDERVYRRPELVQQILKSFARQLEQTAQSVSKHLTGDYVTTEDISPSARESAPDDDIAVTITTQHRAETNFHDDLLNFFIQESNELLAELQTIGEGLKLVGIPNKQESLQLQTFAQKLNRLIGGTAAMGFDQFTQLSRKTSLLAMRCAEMHELSIRIIVSNLNLVIATLAQCFKNLESIKNTAQLIPTLEQRLDICMTALGISAPDIKTQQEIDEILMSVQKKPLQNRNRE